MFQYNNLITESDIIHHAKQLEGKAIKEIGPEYEVNKWISNSSNKGAIGNAIQEVYFGIPANSSKLSDFHYHDLELKVTPIKKTKKDGYSSKERLVLNIINYEEDYKYSFNKSSLINKCNQILLVFYLYEQDKFTLDFKILKVTKFIIPEEDLPTVEEDYNIIIKKIREGKAHLLSEGDTTYLAACTKGAGKDKDWRKQPFSKELAKQRAFSFKSGYMTNFFNSLNNKVENKLNIPNNLSLNEFINKTIKPYYNLSTKELENKLNYYPKLKQGQDKGYLSHLTKQLSQRIFSLEGIDLDKSEQFKKAQLKFKTICLRENKTKNQDMSWPNLDFKEILDLPFDESSWYEWFVETKYLFIYFKEMNNDVYLVNHKIWHAPIDMISELERLYNHIKNMLLENSITVTLITEKSGRVIWKNNLPGKNDFKYFQIRPKGTKVHSFTTLPNGQKFKKQCLFVNKEFIHSLIEM